jgi:hypothetical protein
MRLVIFTARCDPYQPGEQAGFADHVAEDLVARRRVARFADVPTLTKDIQAPITGASLPPADEPPADNPPAAGDEPPADEPAAPSAGQLRRMKLNELQAVARQLGVDSTELTRKPLIEALFAKLGIDVAEGGDEAE